MLTLTQGQRVPVSQITQSETVRIEISIPSSLTIDFACFGLDAAGKLSDERYMVFFNQPEAPFGSVRQIQPNAFTMSLNALPSTIDKLVFTAAIDGLGSMREVGQSSIRILDGITAQAECVFAGELFQQERAIMLLEVYRKNGVWRLSPVLQGFNEGLDALVRHFGGEVADEPAAAPAPAPAAPARVTLEKKVAEKAPALLSLAKKAQVTLEKAKLTDVRARIGLILDVSGSMDGQYRRGRVQEVVNRLLPLAVHFDDDGELDCWAFGERAQQLTPVSMANYANFIDTDNGGWKKWRLGARYNCEIEAIKAAVAHYSKSTDRTPVYILFISDGGVHDNRRITQAIVEAAKLPIFWQFIGIGGKDYGILERLDEMKGRVVDNCNFFALDDLHDISEEALYERMMAEFPQWLKDARAAGVLQQ